MSPPYSKFEKKNRFQSSSSKLPRSTYTTISTPCFALSPVRTGGYFDFDRHRYFGTEDFLEVRHVLHGSFDNRRDFIDGGTTNLKQSCIVDGSDDTRHTTIEGCIQP